MLAGRLNALRAPAFVTGVAVLVLNDFVLKPLFGNWATGKLSDVAGVWAFGYFVMAVTGWRRSVVAAIVAAGFTFWKSPAAEGLIESWNGVAWPAIGRTADWSDLLALLVLALLPPVVAARNVGQPSGRRGFANGAIALCAVLAFVATQRKGDHVCCRGTFVFPGSEQAFVAWLKTTGVKHVRRVESPSGRTPGYWYSFTLPEEFCGSSVFGTVTVREEAGRTHVSLEYLHYNCPNTNDAAVQEQFDRVVARKLNEPSL
ncbi:MAG TPA: hypothetical protein VGF28_19880 [Thermoanaerobaculia bacterium]|jgi:hypothetical protein